MFAAITVNILNINKLNTGDHGIWCATHFLAKEFYKIIGCHPGEALGGAIFNGDFIQRFSPNADDPDLLQALYFAAFAQALAFFAGVEDIAGL